MFISWLWKTKKYPHTRYLIHYIYHVGCNKYKGYVFSYSVCLYFFVFDVWCVSKHPFVDGNALSFLMLHFLVKHAFIKSFWALAANSRDLELKLGFSCNYSLARSHCCSAVCLNLVNISICLSSELFCLHVWCCRGNPCLIFTSAPTPPPHHVFTGSLSPPVRGEVYICNEAI